MKLPKSTDRRNVEQNKKFHAMVGDIADQLPWAGEMLDREDWKRLILAGYYGQGVVPAPVGSGFVVMNKRRSSGLSMEEMGNLLMELEVFGAERNVKWSDE